MLETLDDGMLHFKLRNRETGEETPHAIDVLLLRVVCEELETKHALPVNKDNEYLPTVAFLTELAERIRGLGIDNCSASVASQLWAAGTAEVNALQKKTSETPSSPTGSESSPAA